MEKLLYIAPVNIDFHKPDGVAKKVLNQVNVFAKYFDTHLVAYGCEGIQILNGQGSHIKKYRNGHRRFQLYEYVKELIHSKKYNYVYIRYPKSEPQFIRLLESLKEAGAKIVVEIPTYPYNGNVFESVKNVAIALVDSFYRKKLKNYVSKIITYSDDKSIFGVETINTVNGIIFDKVSIPSMRNKKEGQITLIAVATCYECHGYDRIIEGLNEYYLNGGDINVKFHIVGDGPAVSFYKSLVSKYNLGNHVLLEGYCTGNKLDSLYENADIAVNSLAIHRIKLETESTLKTKEYAAKGLPMISSYFVDAFDEDGNHKFVCRVPSDDSPVNISEIITFYNNLFDEESNEFIASTIRDASKNICDMEITLQGVIDFFRSDLE